MRKNTEAVETANRDMDNRSLFTLSKAPSPLQRRKSFWVCWESENSSFGKCFRDWSGYPSFLPLFMVSPHGAYSGSKVFPNEIDGRVRMFFGWPEKLVLRRRQEHALPSVLVPHPWPEYRKKKFGQLPEKRSGVLYFFPHSNSLTRREFGDLGILRQELSEIQNTLGVVTICLSFHDVHTPLIGLLRSWGFPLVTAGNSSHHAFIDRFYSLVYQFRYTASSSVGSHTYYSIEAGVPHFLIRTKAEFVRRATKTSAERPIDFSDYGDEDDLAEISKFELSLNKITPAPTKTQVGFVNEKLSVGQGITGRRAAQLLWLEFFRGLPRLLFIVLNRALDKIRSYKRLTRPVLENPSFRKI